MSNSQINIDNNWRDISTIQVNIDGNWKLVNTVQANIGNSWKTVYTSSGVSPLLLQWEMESTSTEYPIGASFTLSNATLVSDTPIYDGKYLLSNATSDRCYIADTDIIDFAKGYVSFYVKPTTPGTTTYLLGIIDDASNKLVIQVSYNWNTVYRINITTTIGGTATTAYSPTNSFLDNTLYLVEMRYDLTAGWVKLWLNGDLQINRTGMDGTWSGDGTGILVLGNSSATGYVSAKGQYDHLIIGNEFYGL